MSLNTTAPSYSAGSVLTAAQLNALQDGIQAAWTAYTPAWTGTTTNPAIGNGTVSGSYLQIGKTISWRCIVTMGSTTTYGSGAWLISLPVAASASWAANSVVGVGGDNVAGGTSGAIFARLSSAGAGTVALIAQGGGLSSSFPAAWATGQSFTLLGTYESA